MADSQRVLVVGGTHGNEVTGVHLVRRLQRNPQELTRDSFTAQTLLANLPAMAANRRYLEQDLNRCFTAALLNSEPQNGEQVLAHEINEKYGPKGADSPTDWIIDLHTTTANMGVTLVVQQHDPQAVDMALYVQQKMPDVVIFDENCTRDEDPFLCSIGQHSMLIEVGPVPQGLLRWDVFEQTARALAHALDFIDLRARGEDSLPSPRQADMYQFIEKLHLPRDEHGAICGMIHPELQDRDYRELSPGDPIFISVDGETIPFDYPESVHVAFVNEAAYYDQAHGLSLMRKRTVSWEGE
ncbi:hypothetical protein BST95_01785 [Halioglobus japonicus]|uniref:Aspartoacylase n=1 Tax=Halioglobus japonicus TaxID=930805 RepID=A0AAP8MC29_9GAMM|nr:aspartoacylase [Halioglobus japonicus]AQA17134.1 hypothetical protein BST95_01785 [Halioglobus japonicus]PLW85045.1 aspartoacylase [Halioglobus japonicus]GHD19185.1 putative aspartoacylase [Halioglobus japonicus]